MSKLDQLIAEYCPDGVEFKKLSDIVQLSRGKRVTKRDLLEQADFPVYQNSLTPLGYYNQSNYPANTTFVICAGAAGEVGFSETEYWGADDCFSVICDSSVDNRYIYHLLLNKQPYLKQNVRKASVPRLSHTVIESMRVPVPPLEVQREIVRMLDHFTLLTEELSANLLAELKARKQQYEYYRNKLMTFDSDVPYRRLGDLFPYIRNGFVGTITPYFTDKEHGVRYLEGTNIHNGIISDNEVLYVTREFHEKYKKNELKPDDILMVQSGHIGECAVVGDKYAGANCHALIIMSNGGECNSRFVNHYFHSYIGFKSLRPAITGGTVKHVLATKIKDIKIPCPDIEKQNEIVGLLDRFDSLCSDISIGIPAEIEARQKQYEYYRDKLLTFKEIETA